MFHMPYINAGDQWDHNTYKLMTDSQVSFRLNLLSLHVELCAFPRNNFRMRKGYFLILHTNDNRTSICRVFSYPVMR
ncbi:hypothetical protein CPT06_18395 [Bacillus vallismortis]|nr:hypothetical protein CPT06_18395 [Bacillus vallismortis]